MGVCCKKEKKTDIFEFVIVTKVFKVLSVGQGRLITLPERGIELLVILTLTTNRSIPRSVLGEEFYKFNNESLISSPTDLPKKNKLI